MSKDFLLKFILQEVMGDVPPPAIVQHISTNPGSSIKKVDEIYVLIATLYGEARGEGYKGMQAVMNVIMNRAKGDFNKATEVVLKPKQFSVWNGSSTPYKDAENLYLKAKNGKIKDYEQYRQAADIVGRAMKGQLPDITKGSLFYFNPSIVKPSWAKKLDFAIRIGNHDFYKVKKKRTSK